MKYYLIMTLIIESDGNHLRSSKILGLEAEVGLLKKNLEGVKEAKSKVKEVEFDQQSSKFYAGGSPLSVLPTKLDNHFKEELTQPKVSFLKAYPNPP